jgi:hypothetical protein
LCRRLRYGVAMLSDSLILTAGDTDCEAFHDGWLLQPVNAWSSLAFAVAGIGVMAWAQRVEGHERLLRIIFGLVMIATGVGSFLFHGFDSSIAQFLHDITFLTAIWVLAMINLSEIRRWLRPVGWGVVSVGVGVFSIALLVGPQLTNLLTIVVTIALVAADIAHHRRVPAPSVWYWVSLGAMVLAVAAFVLGRTSGPLCDPDSFFQGHASWHKLSAAAISAYFVATSEARSREVAGSP